MKKIILVKNERGLRKDRLKEAKQKDKKKITLEDIYQLLLDIQVEVEELKGCK